MRSKLTVATAESCTGGMLTALLTDIDGAGRGFDRGFVTYTKESKTDLLGIEPELLDHKTPYRKSSPASWPKARSSERRRI